MKGLALLLALSPFPQATGEVLRVCWGTPVHLDPHRATSRAEARYVGALFEGLVTPGPDGITTAPGMAERWETSADGRTWTFHLREATWSNGEPVTAGDFVFAWRRALRFETGCAYASLFREIRNAGAWLDAAEADLLLLGEKPDEGRLERLARRRHADELRKRGLVRAAAAAQSRADVAEKDLGFEAAGPRTLKVALERRAPWLPDLLCFMSFVPVPEKAVAAHGEGWVKAGKIVTNGPYLFESASPVEIALRKNPAYWDRTPSPERIIVSLTDAEGAVRKFRDGRIDWVAGEMLPESAPEECVTFGVWGTFFLRMNPARAPFDRPEVRTAVARAIDPAAAAKAAGLAPAAGLVPAGFPGYAGAKGPGFDRAAALEGLLRACDYDLTKLPALDLVAVDAGPLTALTESVRLQLEKHLGVRVRVQMMKWPAYSRALAAGEISLTVTGGAGDFFDPLGFLEGWKGASAEFDALVRAAVEEGDPARRLETLGRAEAVLLAAAPVVPLAGATDSLLFRGRIRGLEPNLQSRVPLKHLRVAP